MKQLSIGVVGVGRMGAMHVRVLRQLEHLYDVVGVFDVMLPVARAVADLWGIKAFLSVESLFSACELIVVSTPAETHDAIAMRALAAGCDVMIEKPIAVTLARAQDLLAFAARAERRLMVGHSERFNPVVRGLKQRLGETKLERFESWRFGVRDARVGSLGVHLDWGVHDADLARYFGAAGANSRGQYGASSECASDCATLVFDRAELRLDRRGSERRREIVAQCGDISYRGDLIRQTLRRIDHLSGASEAIVLGDEEPLMAQAKAMALCVAGGESEIASGYDGMRAVELVEPKDTPAGTSRLSAFA